MMNMRQQAERFATTIIDDEVLKVDSKHVHFNILILKHMREGQYYFVLARHQGSWASMENKNLVEGVFLIVHM